MAWWGMLQPKWQARIQILVCDRNTGISVQETKCHFQHEGMAPASALRLMLSPNPSRGCGGWRGKYCIDTEVGSWPGHLRWAQQGDSDLFDQMFAEGLENTVCCHTEADSDQKCGPWCKGLSSQHGFSLSWQKHLSAPTEGLGCRTQAARDLGKQYSLFPLLEAAREWAAFFCVIQNHLTSYLFFTL